MCLGHTVSERPRPMLSGGNLGWTKSGQSFLGDRGDCVMAAGSGALGRSDDSFRGSPVPLWHWKALGEPRFLSPLPASHSAVSARTIFIRRRSQSTPYVEGGEGGRGVRAPGVLRARVGKVGDS